MASYSFKMEADVLYAIHNYNTECYSPELKLIDACILALVKSFEDSGKVLYMSNAELSRILISTEEAVKKSIKRLDDAELIVRETHWDDRLGKSVRTITLNKKQFCWLVDMNSNFMVALENQND